MGKAKHTRISQRMSQHIIQLKFALRITASEKTYQTYRDDVYISHPISFVNTFFIR